MNQNRKKTERVNVWIKESVKQLEESSMGEKNIRENEGRKLQERIKEIEEALRKGKSREVLEKEMETEKKVKEVRESVKEMEMKVEASMKQIKILDLDFGAILVKENSSKGGM